MEELETLGPSLFGRYTKVWTFLALVIGEESRSVTRFIGIPVEGSGMGTVC